jgi:diadenylate cyclase
MLISGEGYGALIVLERETGLEDTAESGVMLHADVSADLLVTIFSPRTPLHDGAVIIRGDRIVAAAALLPLTEMSLQSERFGTRHRAALGITESTDSVAVVVSEESGQMSVVERARIVRVPSEAQLERALRALLEAPARRRGILDRTRGRPPGAGSGGATGTGSSGTSRPAGGVVDLARRRREGEPDAAPVVDDGAAAAQP